MTASISMMNGPSFRLVTLGELRLLRQDNPADQWFDTGLGEKPCLLVTVMALGNGPVVREELCDLLWEGAEAAKARNSLRQAIFRVRRVLGSSSIIEGDDGLWFEHPRLVVDAATLEMTGTGKGEAALQGRQFARPRAAMGRRFRRWRESLMERRWGLAPMAELPLPSPEQSEGIDLQHPDAPTLRRLDECRRRAAEGTPVSIWCSGTTSPRVTAIVDAFSAQARQVGARVLRIGPHHQRYTPFTLEHDIAQALWEAPGAAGISPEHREALMAFGAGRAVPPQRLRSALRDLLDAVSDDGPLVMLLEHPGRYARQALSDVVELIGQMSSRPICLLLADHAGGRPVSSRCVPITVSELGAAVEEQGVAS